MTTFSLTPLMSHRALRVAIVATITTLGSTTPARAQNAPPSDPLFGVPAINTLIAKSRSEFAEVVARFTADESSLTRRYDAEDSPDQRARMRNFYTGWRTRLRESDFAGLSQEAKVDYVLLDNYLVHELALLDRTDKLRQETAAALPFEDPLLRIYDSRRRMERLDPTAAARTVNSIAKTVDSLRALYEAPAGGRGNAAPEGPRAPTLTRSAGMRAAARVDQLRGTIGNWYRYYDGFDPLFSWWVSDPYRKLDDAMTRYARTLRERVVGWRQTAPAVAAAPAGGGGRGGGGGQAAAADEPIVGVPIGADGLKADLDFEMIPYTAEELIAIAEREYAFSLSEAKKAAREMGFGDDWKAASEKVKTLYVEPGKQTEIIRDLARQAEQYFGSKDWVTIPELATEDWRMEMLSPERQRVSPFFLGGEAILVSYPTNTMTDEEKLMSMRGNNPHFSHATVFHELNPGHHFQGFMTARYNAHRRMFNTPFWNEGIALYWEMFLWDEGFHASPEDRLGALFWRMHRSARIIFSLSFHLGKMTPEESIDFLVDKVNFERANAEAEVRRSFNGSYSPLYQAAYMLGGLQMRALHGELVRTGKMTNRQFHDAVMQGGPMPITMVRARLTNQPLRREGATPWRFADAVPAPKPFPTR